LHLLAHGARRDGDLVARLLEVQVAGAASKARRALSGGRRRRDMTDPGAVLCPSFAWAKEKNFSFACSLPQEHISLNEAPLKETRHGDRTCRSKSWVLQHPPRTSEYTAGLRAQGESLARPRRTSKVLYELDDHALADIGLSRADVEGLNEASWQDHLPPALGR
jgi:uncharacterized protein YjiS (DUF1127 family)